MCIFGRCMPLYRHKSKALMDKKSAIKYHKFQRDILLKDSFKWVDTKTFAKAHSKEPIHRHSFVELQFIWKGAGNQSIDFREYKISENQLFLLQPNQVHQANMASFEAYDILVFQPEYLGLFHDLVILQPYFRLSSSCVNLSNQQVQLLKKYLHLLKNEYDNDAELIIVQSLLAAILIHIQRWYAEIAENPTNLDERTIRFLQLVEENYKTYHTANYYADHLNISEKHLSTIVSADLGKSASSFIRDRITLEIKRMLIYSTYSHKEIAYLLGFKDPYYMSNFFKRQTKMRPSDFSS